MSSEAAIAIISGVFTLAGTVITVIATAKKQSTDMGTKIAVIDERISTLKTSVDRHNGFAQRMPVVEEQIKVINHRINDLEDK